MRLERWPLLPGAAATTSLIGAGANAGVGYLINGEINPNDVILGYWTGVFTQVQGYGAQWVLMWPVEPHPVILKVMTH